MLAGSLAGGLMLWLIAFSVSLFGARWAAIGACRGGYATGFSCLGGYAVSRARPPQSAVARHPSAVCLAGALHQLLQFEGLASFEPRLCASLLSRPS